MTDSYKLLVMAVGRRLGMRPSVSAAPVELCERCGSVLRMIGARLRCFGCGATVTPD